MDHPGLREFLRLDDLIMPLLLLSFITIPIVAEGRVARTMAVSVSGGVIEITFPEAPTKVSRQDLLDWVHAAAEAVSNYYGRFPVPRLALSIQAGSGSGVRHGVTYPRDGGFIRITVGEEAEVSQLKDDWILTHEMIHLAFPSMPKEHHWIEEGISTYVEPVARAQVGQIPITEVWKQWIRDMPQGEPGPGDEGLDHTPTWGGTYWGGAMFCLVAEVRIRERTQNRKGLRDALRGILNAGGVITQNWDIKRALEAGDKATRADVLRTLYTEMATKPDPVDLGELWQKLGVRMEDGEVVFDDSAQEAAIRKAITAPPGKHSVRRLSGTFPCGLREGRKAERSL